MKRESRKSRAYVPFSYKIMIPYLLLIMITEVFIGYYTYSRLTTSSSVLIQLNMKMTFQQITDNIKFQLEDVQQISDSLFQSTEIQKALVSDADAFGIYKISTDQLFPLLAAPLQLTRNNIRILLYVNNERFYESFKDLNHMIHEKTYNLLYMSRIQHMDWYNKLAAEDRDNVWLQVDNDSSLQNISLLRKLIWFNDYQTQLGFLRITVKLQDLFASINNVWIGEGAIIRIKDSTTDQVVYQADGGNQPQRETRYKTLDQIINGSSLKLEILVPQEFFLKDARNIRDVTLTVCISSFLIMLFIGGLVGRLSNKRMKKIIAFVRQLQSGQFRKRIHISGHDEFAQIAVAFNKMAVDIDELIRTVYMQEIHVKEAEMEALQAQINPHFLYNTLSSINSLANLGHIDKLSEMVSGLAKFYRLTLNDGLIMIPLNKEFEQIQAYVDIQQIKYANRFEVAMELEPEISDCEIPKLIIQPFVENALKHAWYGERLAIQVTGHKIQDRIFLTVEDNGVGITEERLAECTGEQKVGDGCGIRNVHDRVRLRYGTDYGVTVSSTYGAGTTVQISIPYEATLSNRSNKSTNRGNLL